MPHGTAVLRKNSIADSELGRGEIGQSSHCDQPPALDSWPMRCLKKLGSFLLKYKWEIAGVALIASSIATAGMLTIVATIGLGLFGASLILIGILQKDCVNQWLDRKILERAFREDLIKLMMGINVFDDQFSAAWVRKKADSLSADALMNIPLSVARLHRLQTATRNGIPKEFIQAHFRELLTPKQLKQHV
jgi:hypothetical protein